MAGAKLARLKLLMEDEEFDWTPRKVAVSRCQYDAGVQVDLTTSVQTADNHLSTFQAHVNTQNEPIDPIISTPEDEWRITEANLPEKSTISSFGQSQTQDIDISDPEKRLLGQVAEASVKFSPILAISKYPYKYLDSLTADSEEVSQKFFAGGIFWQRRWTIYYIHLPISVSVKPLLLVPSSEFKTLLREISNDLKLSLGFPNRSVERGLVLEFSGEGIPRPRFLGICTSREAFSKMEANIPKQAFGPKDEIFKIGKTDDRSYAAFMAKMETAIQATKNKSKGSKEKKKAERVQLKSGWCRQLRRTQRYLGLRPRRNAPTKENSSTDPNLTWKELLEAKEKQDREADIVLPTLTLEEPPPYPFDENVVFVCVDVESFERNHHNITEIGISTLDTSDLVGIAPGEKGINWMTKIRARHFRINEYKHLVNKDFIVGCGDRFEKCFGTSEFISIKHAPQVVASCFRPPFSISQSPLELDFVLSGLALADTVPKRNIILVGHDTKTDINYLRDIGYDPSNLSNLTEVLDTSELYRALVYESQPRGLGGLLYDLGLTGWNLHNAGNDAAYTLQALIAIAFKGLSLKSDRMPSDRQSMMDAAVKEAEERFLEEEQEWDLADGHDDGGPPEVKLEKAQDLGPDVHGITQRGSSRGRAGSGSNGTGRGARGRGGGAKPVTSRGNSKSRYEERKAREFAGGQKEEQRVEARYLMQL